MTLKIKIFIFLFLLLGTVFAQQNVDGFTGNRKVDVLLMKAEESKDSQLKSLKIAKEALKVAREEGKDIEAKVLSYIAEIYWENNLLKEAEKYYKRAIRIYEVLKDRKGIAHAFNQIADMYQRQGIHNLAIEFYSKAAFEFQLIGDKKSQAKAMNDIGYSNFQRTNYPDALNSFDKALEMLREIKDSVGLATTLNNLGLVYYELGNFELSVENYLEAFRIWEIYDDQKSKAKLLNNIGLVYADWNNYDMAKDYYQKSLDIRLEINDKMGMSSSYNNLGTAYLNEKNYARALEYYQKSYDIKKELNYKMGIGNSLNNMGYIYLLLEDYDSSLMYLKQSLEIKLSVGDLKGCINTYGNLGRTYLMLNHLDKAQNNYDRGLQLADSLNLKKYKIELYQGLSEVYFAKGDHLKAYQFFKKFSILKEEIFNNSSLRAITQINSKYEIEAKEREYEILKQDNKIKDLELKREKTIRHFLLYAIILAVFIVILIMFYYLNRRKILRELKEKNEEMQITNERLKVSEDHLTDLNATKDKFFSIIAHDIKNPFNALLGLTDLLSSKVDRLEKDEIKLYTNNINKSANSVYSILDNLLQWSRSQTGKLAFEPESIPLSDIIESNISLHSLSAEKKGISIKSGVTSNINVWVDEQLINTVFRNLISNAIKFSNFNSEILIFSRMVKDMVEISIQDNGVGISKEDQRKLFRIDINYSTTGTSSEQGTGLGLIICKEFIEKHSGKIWVESDVDRGSTFIFTLPIASSTQSSLSS